MNDLISILPGLLSDPKVIGSIVGGIVAGGVAVHSGRRILAGVIRIVGIKALARAKSTPDPSDDEVAEEIKKTTDDVANIVSESKDSKEGE